MSLRESHTETESCDVLVIGAGGAGLIAALSAAEAGAAVCVICPDEPGRGQGRGGNTAVSGGGFTMSTERFPADEHIRLTMQAGCGLNDPALVRTLCHEADAARRWLEAKLRVAFRPKDDGQGYWFPGGGAGLLRGLAALARAESSIRLLEGVTATRLLVDEGGICRGAQGVTASGTGVTFNFKAGATVLATGGYAGIYARHDNAGEPMGEGIALALRAGAAVRDLEFVQFYPLGLAEPSLPPVAVLRPFPPQARVINGRGESLTEKYLDTDDLNAAVGAQRDLLAQAIEAECREGPVFLDLTGVDRSRHKGEGWPSLRSLSRYGFPWESRPAPIAPIAHHTLGGIATDAWGRTGVAGLYAVGEVAGGLHGANRLGGNSLTECLVFGRRAGTHAAQAGLLRPVAAVASSALLDPRPTPAIRPGASKAELRPLQRLCWAHLGLTRGAGSLQRAVSRLQDLEAQADASAFKLRCGLAVARAVAAFALRRRESRGAHRRSDFPEQDPAWRHSSFAKRTEKGIEFVATCLSC